MVSEAAIKKFATDLEAYSMVNLKIPIKGGLDPKTGLVIPPQLVPFRFNESQKLVHKKLVDQWERCKRIRAVILKSRQQGMSTYVSARFFRKLHLWPNHNAYVLADELSRAQTLFGMYDNYAHHLPEEMKPMMRWVSKKKELFFDNPKDRMRAEAPGLQSGIQVETAGDVDAGRSATIHLAHLSEMGMWPNAAEVLLSMLQAVPDYGSEILIESTAKGIGNAFHTTWEEAWEGGEGLIEGQNGFLAIFIPWWWHKEYRVQRLTKAQKRDIRDTMSDYERTCFEVGFEFEGETHRLVEEQLAWRRMTIREKAQGDERAFRQEYPATPEEAFIASGASFFSEDLVKRYISVAKTPIRRCRLQRLEMNGEHAIVPVNTELGWLRVWEWPRHADFDHDDPGGDYVIGADTAEGKLTSKVEASFDDPDREKGGRDFCSADVVDVRTMRQVAHLHGRMAPEIFAEQLNLLGRFYSKQEPSGLRVPALMAPENNHSSGRTVVRLLRDRYQYPNLYRPKPTTKRFRQLKEEYGFLTSGETRRPMLDNLAEHVHTRLPVLNGDGTVSSWIPCKETLKEMLAFILADDGKPQAQEGAHDDRVMSLGITLFVAEMRPTTIAKHHDVTDLVEVGTSPTGMFSW